MRALLARLCTAGNKHAVQEKRFNTSAISSKVPTNVSSAGATAEHPF